MEKWLHCQPFIPSHWEEVSNHHRVPSDGFLPLTGPFRGLSQPTPPLACGLVPCSDMVIWVQNNTCQTLDCSVLVICVWGTILTHVVLYLTLLIPCTVEEEGPFRTLLASCSCFVTIPNILLLTLGRLSVMFQTGA